MHELSVTESILEIANRHAAQASARRVTDIYLVIGNLTSLVDDSIQFYWDMISQGTLSEGATLHFQRVRARMHCQDCGNDYEMDSKLQPCPNCGSFSFHVQAGEEFYMDSIEIEQ